MACGAECDPSSGSTLVNVLDSEWGGASGTSGTATASGASGAGDFNFPLLGRNV